MAQPTTPENRPDCKRQTRDNPCERQTGAFQPKGPLSVSLALLASVVSPVALATPPRVSKPVFAPVHATHRTAPRNAAHGVARAMRRRFLSRRWRRPTATAFRWRSPRLKTVWQKPGMHPKSSRTMRPGLVSSPVSVGLPHALAASLQTAGGHGPATSHKIASPGGLKPVTLRQDTSLIDGSRGTPFHGTPVTLRPAVMLSGPSVRSGAKAITPSRSQPVRSTVEVCAIQAREDKNTTLVAVTLHGRVKARLSGEGKALDVFLPNAFAGAQLSDNIASGGLVTRFALDAATPAHPEARLHMELSAPARAELVDGPNAESVVVRLTPLDKTAPMLVRDTGNGLYDVDAYQADAASLLKSVAQCGHTSVVMIGVASARITVDLRQVTIPAAIEMLAKAAGLSTRRDGSLYIVGSRKDMEAAYPEPLVAPVPVNPPVIRQEVYHCNYIYATELVTTLEKMFPKETLRLAVGGGPISPRLESAATVDVTGVQGGKSESASGGGTESGPIARDVALWGEEAVVTQALALAKRLDVRRPQVKISVSIADVSLTALRELGVKWSWSQFSVQEVTPHDINFGTFTHQPVNITAALSALEQNDKAKVLASPSISLLDGEHGYVLIGDRLLFPKLIGYTQASTPIFDKEEVRVGIYLQVAAQVGANGEMTLTIYPQVSTVTGYLTVPNMGSYPQIGTREQKTTVRVKDGEKIIVGGLIRDEDINNVQRVPLLSRIPLFGELFTYRKRTHNKSEVIITITPEIIKD